MDGKEGLCCHSVPLLQLTWHHLVASRPARAHRGTDSAGRKRLRPHACVRVPVHAAVLLARLGLGARRWERRFSPALGVIGAVGRGQAPPPPGTGCFATHPGGAPLPPQKNTALAAPGRMEGVPAVPNGLERRSAMSDGAYVTEGWLYKLSSNSMVGKDKFQKRWFMIEHTANGGMLSYCPSPEDRTLSKEPLVRPLPAPDSVSSLLTHQLCAALGRHTDSVRRLLGQEAQLRFRALRVSDHDGAERLVV
eukprot:COSAG01_NODE_1497_length_10121_cov_74.291359_12_plen_250_part_00